MSNVVICTPFTHTFRNPYVSYTRTLFSKGISPRNIWISTNSFNCYANASRSDGRVYASSNGAYQTAQVAYIPIDSIPKNAYIGRNPFGGGFGISLILTISSGEFNIDLEMNVYDWSIGDGIIASQYMQITSNISITYAFN